MNPNLDFRPPTKRQKPMRFRLDPVTGCIRCVSHRYGLDGLLMVAIGGRRLSYSHWLYEKLVGPIPVGARLVHTCGNPTCMNVRHMTWK